MLFPIPAAFCDGLLCGTEIGAHVGVVSALLSKRVIVVLFTTTIFSNKDQISSFKDQRSSMQVLLFQCMSLVAMTVACTLHYEYTVIARMMNCRRVTVSGYSERNLW